MTDTKKQIEIRVMEEVNMLPKLSVKKPYTVGVGVVLILILGIVAFANMTTDLLPSMDLPMMIVSTPYPGASPEKVETAVTKPLEQALATTSGLSQMSSISRENISVVMLEFNQEMNMDSAMLEVSGKLDQAKGRFEEGVASPVVLKMNPDMMPVMMLSVDIEGQDVKSVSRFVKEQLMPEFERIEGVATVSSMGLVEEYLEIKLDEDKLAALNEQLLFSVNEELGAKQQEITKAKEELGGMKNKLQEEQNKQLAQLEAGAEALEQTKQQLEAQISAIGLSKKELEEKIQEAEGVYGQNQLQLSGLKEALENLPDDHPEYVNLQQKITQLEAQQQQIKLELARLNKGLGAVTSLETLEEKQNQMAMAKNTLEKEFGKAQQELVKGEGELETASKELEKATEGIVKETNIKDKITVDMVANLLKAEHFSMPVGYIKGESEEVLVKVGEPFEDTEALENLLLMNMEPIGDITLKDVATIQLKDNSGEIYANINGNPGVMLTFQKASGYSTSEVTKAVRAKISELSSQNAAMTITTLSDQGVYINIIIRSVLANLIYGGILAVIVLWVFLRSFKTTLVVALSIPISVLFAIVLMYFSGVTLNIISLSGLALGVGMLVDNSIVAVENIYRLRSNGAGKKEAAIEGAKQISGAIFASTLTTIGVFLPIIFTSGMTKQIFVDMGLTIGYSLIASLLVALTVVPAISATVLNVLPKNDNNFLKKLIGVYEAVLRKSLRYKPVVLMLVLGLFAFCGYAATQMPTSFMPTMDSTQMTVMLSEEKNANPIDLYAESDELINRLRTLEDIETIGAVENDSASEMMFYIILKEDKKHSNLEVEEMIYDKTKDMPGLIQVSASTMDMSALSGSGIQLMIKGPELDQLTQTATDLAKLLESVEGTVDVSDGLGETVKEMRIRVDKNKAMNNGLTVAQVYQLVTSALKEQVEVGAIALENRDYPVIVAQTSGLTQENMMQHSIKLPKEGKSIKLQEIATLEETRGLPDIKHDRQSRYITVAAGVDAKHNIGLVSREVEAKLKDFKLPENYSVELMGENQMIQDTLKDLISMTLLAVLFVYLIMVAQFQSLLSPFIVMFTIPLAFTGGLLALLLTGSELSIVSMLGFLVLAGVVVNNGIVLVDYMNQLRDQGTPKKEAIVEASCTRLRPILMTALTTILAMSTMAIGVGMGAEMTQGLAIVTIGGLLYGTVLTLVVVPVLYDLFSPKGRNESYT